MIDGLQIIGGHSQTSEITRSRTAGGKLQCRLVFFQCRQDQFIMLDRPQIQDRLVEEARANLIDTLKQFTPFLGISNPIGDQVDIFEAVIFGQDFDRAIGISDRRRVIANHNETAAGCSHERQHRGRYAGGHVHDQVIQIIFQRTEGLDNARRLHHAQTGHFTHA